MKGPQQLREETEYNLNPNLRQRDTNLLEPQEHFRRQIDALQQENQYLRGYGNRLETELKVYQTRFPNETIKDSEVQLQNPIDDLPPWVAASQYMCPLLVAYDQRIAELQRQVSEFEETANIVRLECEALSSRNTELEKELEERLETLSRRLNPEKGVGDTRLFVLGDGAEFRELEERLSILSEQNDLLRETESRWREERKKLLAIVEEHEQTTIVMQQEMLQAQTREDTLIHQQTSLQTQISGLKEQVDNLSSQITASEETKHNALSQLSGLERQLESAQQGYDEVCNALQETKLSSKQAIQVMEEETSSLQRERNDLQNQLQSIHASLTSAAERESANSRELELNKRDFHGIVQTLENLEKMVSSYKERERMLIHQANEAKLHADACLLAQERAVHAEKHAQMEIQRLNGRISQRIEAAKKEFDNETQHMTERHNSAQQKLQRELNELTEECTELRQMRDQIARKHDSVEYEMRQLQESYKSRIATLSDEVNNLKANLTDILCDKQRAEEKAQRITSDLENHKDAWQKERAIRDKQHDELQNLQDRKDRELLEFKEQALTMQEKIDQFEHQIETQHRIRSEIEANMIQQLEDRETAHKKEINGLQDQLKGLHKIHDEAERQAKELVDAQNRMAAKWRDENRSTVSQFQATISSLKQENASLTTANIDLGQRVSQLVFERDEALGFQDLHTNKEREYSNEIMARDQSIHQLRSSVQSMQETEKVLLNQNSQLRCDLEAAEMKVKRLQRQAEIISKRSEAQKLVHQLSTSSLHVCALWYVQMRCCEICAGMQSTRSMTRDLTRKSRVLSVGDGSL